MARMNAKSQRELFEFGNRCHSCQNRYCLKCFTFECTLCRKDCKCKTTECECRRLPKMIEKKLTEAKYWLVSQPTTPSSVDIELKYNFPLHKEEAVLRLKIVLHKDFDKRNEKSYTDYSKNYMELIVDIKEGSHLRKKYTSKQTVTINIPATKGEKFAVYCGEETSDRHKQCLNDLNRRLEEKNIVLEFTNNPDKTLTENEKPLLVISLIHSRAVSDVIATLSRIEERFYKQIILVLLHFKQSDQRKSASELKSDTRFSAMNIIDLFQQPESDNINDVYNNITLAIHSFK